MPDFLDLHLRTNKTLRDIVDTRLRPHGLHLGQDHVLAALWQQDGRTPGEVAAALNVTTPTIVRAATRMTAAGLLIRRPDQHDSRLVRLWLTDAGRALQAPIEEVRQQLEDEVTADLTATERDQLLRALAKIRHSAAVLLTSQNSDAAANTANNTADNTASDTDASTDPSADENKAVTQ
jgi:DNA-binding MarR family transcriptional regulator